MRLNVKLGALALFVCAVVTSCGEKVVTPNSTSAKPQADLVPGTTPIVGISQIYGGGGNSGATLKNDFIELFNPGDSAVHLSGWSVQYAAAAGTTWQATNLSGLI